MKNRIIIIMDHDLIGYPPTLSLIRILLSLGKTVVFIGQYSDDAGKNILQEKGVTFLDLPFNPNYKIKNGIIRRLNILIEKLRYKHKFFDIVKKLEYGSNDLIWHMYYSNTPLIYRYLEDKDFVAQFYEFCDADFGGKYKLLSPGYSATRLLQKAKAVIHCEYNRACIMNGMYGIGGKLNILPNKPVFEEAELSTMPKDVYALYNNIQKQIRGRKAIMYQGIFTSKERRLEEFCDAVALLPDEFVFIAMGGGDYWESLREKYKSDRYIFIPFVAPPHHLRFTELSYIGVLNYLPVPTSIADVINPLYCAPNKLFEYTKYSKPIIGNDIPGLREITDSFKCGEIVENPMTAARIAETILRISVNYFDLQIGAKTYFESVNLNDIVSGIVESIE